MAADMTIEQLAARSGMSVRNIRAHQARGLLAPPEVRLRVGYYGPEHVAQLQLIRQLQDDGFNLAGIKRLLDDTPEIAQRLARIRQALSAPPEAEQAQTLTVGELGRRFRVQAHEAPRVLERAERLGVLVASGPDHYRVPSPSLLAVAEEVVSHGVSLESALSVLEAVQAHCDAISARFVKVFVDEVWRPFELAGHPQERLDEIETSIERLRPLATEALNAIFARSLSAQTEAAFRSPAHRDGSG